MQQCNFSGSCPEKNEASKRRCYRLNRDRESALRSFKKVKICNEEGWHYEGVFREVHFFLGYFEGKPTIRLGVSFPEEGKVEIWIDKHFERIEVTKAGEDGVVRLPPNNEFFKMYEISEEESTELIKNFIDCSQMDVEELIAE